LIGIKYNQVKELKISKLSLGTAQLGMNYGVANKKGKLNKKNANNILELCVKKGINTFDSAIAYGESEKILGTFFKKAEIKNPIVITKIPKIQCDSHSSFVDIYTVVKEFVISSSKRLGLSQITICLLHEPSDMISFDRKVVESLIKLKEEDLIRFIGVSIYNPKDVLEFFKTDSFDVIQVPINIFDLRLIKNGFLDRLDKKGVIVFGRSIFLQGLFFMDPYNLPSSLAIAKNPLIKLNKISLDSGISIAELAFSFVRDIPYVDSLVVGVETQKQLLDNINLIKSSPLSNKVRKKIFDEFSNQQEDLIDPSKWKIK